MLPTFSLVTVHVMPCARKRMCAHVVWWHDPALVSGDHIGKALATALMNDGNALWNACRRRDAGREADFGHFAFWKIVRCNVLASDLNMCEPYNFSDYQVDPTSHGDGLCGTACATDFHAAPKVSVCGCVNV